MMNPASSCSWWWLHGVARLAATQQRAGRLDGAVLGLQQARSSSSGLHKDHPEEDILGLQGAQHLLICS
jgi:hypothetical protein